MQSIIKNTSKARENFFRLIYGTSKGYMYISYVNINNNSVNSKFFKYPEELDAALRTMTEKQNNLTHAYYCPQLYKTPTQPSKNNVLEAHNIWVDLDSCDPALLSIAPSVLIQSSPGRWQALWVLEKPISKYEAASISRKITYFHSPHGANKSGWDLSQLLRIPYTPNFKYGRLGDAPLVTIASAHTQVFTVDDFNIYPEIAAAQFMEEECPPLADKNPIDILMDHRATMNPLAFSLFKDAPKASEWDTAQEKLITLCVEAGLNRQETFTVVNSAACNKVTNANQSINELWKEILRGYVKNLENKNQILSPTITIPDLLTNAELDSVLSRETYIERYMNWAKSVTDAAPQYHQAGAFASLSAMVSGSVKLETSFGSVIPNLWFSILGETTITRKSTAISMAKKLIVEIDDDIIFASDGSSEGILSGLSLRANKPSLFYRDEVTGLFQAIMSKDYMSDMLQHFTNLYDGDTVKRLLRKETIIVKDPIFLMLTGGIKEKIQLMLTEEHIASGFIPRFIFITAEADITSMRPIGPAVVGNDEVRERVKNELVDIRNHYDKTLELRRGKKSFGKAAYTYEAFLTPNTWERYNAFEYQMINTAIQSKLNYLTPVYDRLAKSTLKAAILIAASRQREQKVTVELNDLLHAIYYCIKWREYALDVVSCVGKTKEERLIAIMYAEIKSAYGGKNRHELMRTHQLTKKSAADLFETMEQRKLIFGVRSGNDINYRAS